MAEAQCSCGALHLTLGAPPQLVVACHCLDCQRRTGAPFGVGAFFPAAAMTVSGETREFAREGESGGTVRNRFCPECGSTVYWTADALPGLVGVAVGAFGEPGYTPPSRSIFERSKHGWVRIDGAVQHFPQSARAGGTA